MSVCMLYMLVRVFSGFASLSGVIPYFLVRGLSRGGGGVSDRSLLV